MPKGRPGTGSRVAVIGGLEGQVRAPGRRERPDTRRSRAMLPKSERSTIRGWLCLLPFLRQIGGISPLATAAAMQDANDAAHTTMRRWRCTISPSRPQPVRKQLDHASAHHVGEAVEIDPGSRCRSRAGSPSPARCLQTLCGGFVDFSISNSVDQARRYLEALRQIRSGIRRGEDGSDHTRGQTFGTCHIGLLLEGVVVAWSPC
jgi:hypothetical protein